MAYTIGIDLGTTNSLCAVFEQGRPRLIPNSHGEFLTPSIVGLLETGDIVVGAAARELRVAHPERAVWCFKELWRPRMFRYVQACHAPPQLSIPELQRSAEDIGHAGVIELVLGFAMRDRAMHLFNHLQLFVR